MIVLLLAVITPIILLYISVIDINRILSLGEDFQYNIISMSAVIGGFLFTGISILMSAIDKERIERLWKNNYLDNLYRAAFTGMISNLISIVSALTNLCVTCSERVVLWIIRIEVVTLFVGIIFFAWCIYYLLFIITRINKE